MDFVQEEPFLDTLKKEGRRSQNPISKQVKTPVLKQPPKQPEKVVLKQSEKQPKDPVLKQGKKTPVSPVLKQPKTLVKQGESVVLDPVLKQPKTATKTPVLKQPPKQPEKVVLKQSEKQIVSVPSEDISKWKNYANIYYKRSIKKVSAKLSQSLREKSEESKIDNREKYKHYRSLLETSGFKVKELKGSLDIKPLKK